MISLKKLISTTSVALLLGTAALVTTTGVASARMVCNADGDCWHTDDAPTVTYPGTGYVSHPDDWYFHQTWDQNHHYRDYHEGRGYYRGGIWITL